MAIRSLPLRKAPGPDGIYSEHLCYAAEVSAPIGLQRLLAV